MELDGQTRLFQGEIVAIEIQLFHAGPSGWEVRAVARRDQEPWGIEPTDFFCELTRSEAYDVVTAVASSLLGF